MPPTVTDQEELKVEWQLCDDKLAAAKVQLMALQTVARENLPLR